jgi:hypothetical protein
VVFAPAALAAPERSCHERRCEGDELSPPPCELIVVTSDSYEREDRSRWGNSQTHRNLVIFCLLFAMRLECLDLTALATANRVAGRAGQPMSGSAALLTCDNRSRPVGFGPENTKKRGIVEMKKKLNQKALLGKPVAHGARPVARIASKARKAPKAGDTVHLLIRVRSENGQTINAHADLVATRGAAIFGKLGQPVGPAFRKLLNDQIQHGTKTYLFLTTREGWNGEYVTYRCPLRQVHEILEAAKRSLVPTYYIGEAANIRTWLEVSGIDRLSREEMNRIFVLSSGRSVMSVIKSTAAVFRVVVGDPKTQEPTRKRLASA